jgi:ribosome assembly protein 1
LSERAGELTTRPISNPTKVDKIVSSLAIKVRPQDLRAKDSRNLLLSIFAQWLPLAPSTFRAVIDKIPAPPLAQASRVPRMLHPKLGHSAADIAPTNKLEKDLYEGGEEDDRFCVAYVSKMFSVKTNELPQNQRKQLTAEDMRAMAKASKEKRDRRAKILEEGGDPDAVDESAAAPAEEETPIDPNHESLIGFSRLYSGTIVLGQSLYAVLPKYNADLGPQHPSNSRHIATVKVEQLYMMMGRELVAVPYVHAGNLFAIGGLEGTVGRNATLCGMGKEKEVREGAEREEDRACLVNLAGVILTVSHAPSRFLTFKS